MKDEQLKKTLEAIAEDAIPQDLDLWEEIEMQLSKDTPPRRTYMRRFAQVAATVIVLLMVSTGVYAVVNQIIDGGDETIQVLNEADLLTMVDQAQTIDDITVTLEWAYADANRIAIAYQTAFDETQVPQPEFGFNFEATLYDANGQTIPSFLGGGGGGGRTNDMRVTSANANYDPSGLDLTNEEIDLRLVVTAYAHIPPELRSALCPRIDPESETIQCRNIPAPQNGGGGGGGTPPQTFNRPDPILVTEYVPKTFTFDFSLPLYPLIEHTPNDTVTANGQAVTLKQVSITPSLTELELCFPELSPDPGHVIGLTLETEQAERFFIMYYDESQLVDGCVNKMVSFPILPDDVDTLTVTVDYIRNFVPNTQATADAIREKIEAIYGDGVNLEFYATLDGSLSPSMGMAIQFNELSIDHNTQQRQVDQAYFEIVGGIIGPWTFSIDLN